MCYKEYRVTDDWSGPKRSALIVWKKRSMTREAIEQRAWDLMKPITESLSMRLVDVEYLKEGDSFILRAYIDKEGGVGIDDCEAASRAYDPELDREDFIRDAYTLEVSSPGLGRPLRRPHDFEYALGREIEVKTYRAIDKEKEFRGVMTAFDAETVTIEAAGGERQIPRKDISLIRLAFDF